MRLLLVCNPGGHFSTMMSLKEFWSAHYREWVTYPKFDTERLRRQEIVYWVIMQEARMVGRAIINFFPRPIYSLPKQTRFSNFHWC